jgi:hypothetical protein
LFGTENEGFCALISPIFSCIAIATVLKIGEIRVQNAKFVGKRKSLNDFNTFDFCGPRSLGSVGWDALVPGDSNYSKK